VLQNSYHTITVSCAEVWMGLVLGRISQNYESCEELRLKEKCRNTHTEKNIAALRNSDSAKKIIKNSAC
jgi:hypothetical protein